MASNLGSRSGHELGSSWIWLTVLVFQCCFLPLTAGAPLIFWSAYVDVQYFDMELNNTIYSICECGVFGRQSPLKPSSGLITLPDSDPLACSGNTSFSPTAQQWIALIKKGNCSFSVKIRAAKQNGASAVIIYNTDGTGNDTNLMNHSDADGIVAIMVGNTLGSEIANLTRDGTDVYVGIMVARLHGLWYMGSWAYVLSFVFIGITVIITFYFAYLLFKRMHIKRQLRRQQMEMKRETEKAISKLEVRILRTGDPIEEESYEEPASSAGAFCLATVVTSADQQIAFGRGADTVYCEQDTQTLQAHVNSAFEEEPETMEHQDHQLQSPANNLTHNV
ncbi:hypothetical protein DNTS_004851 [Danionella cerebrum]|uniref:PA domain-containing protein n=1 Tax=Danionella cerebrum TaxID=2873325 RepID=A0A553RAX3_9TELE|nr:hypothetical protein DNTS_004851 [Danionella translucida]